MFLSSLILRRLLILICDFIKIDWLLIENLKAKIKNKDNHITKKIRKLKSIGNVVLLVSLVCSYPVITVLYFRKGYFKWDGLKNTNIKFLFILSNLIGSFLVGGIISLLF